VAGWSAVSFRDGTATEGPFVSTEPALCGYYLIEADNPEQARRIARLCPARYGGVELRPVKPTSVR
jgi:hypothetical protein